MGVHPRRKTPKSKKASPPARKTRDGHLKPYQKVPDGFVPTLVALEDLTEKDVILGRGTTVASYYGNIRFRQVIGPFRKKYQRTKVLSEKRAIAEEALSKIGRFVEVLEWDASGESPTLFQTVTEARAMERTCQSLREQKWNPVAKGAAAFRNAKSAADIARKLAASGQGVLVDHHLRSPEEKEAKIMEWNINKDKAITTSSRSAKKTTERQAFPPQEPETESDDDSNSDEDHDQEEGLSGRQSRSARYGTRGARSEGTRQLEKAENTPEDSSSGPRRSSRRSKPTIQDSPPVVQPSRKKRSKEVAKTKKAPTKTKKAIAVKKKSAPVKHRKRSYMVKGPEVLVDLKDTDVAFGRSRAQVHHPGNSFFRQFVTYYRKQYNQRPAFSKKTFAIELIKEYPGRFVELVPGTEDQYRLAHLDRAAEKFQQALRELKWSASIEDFVKKYKPGKAKPQYPLDQKVVLDESQDFPSSEGSVMSTDPTVDSTPQSSSDEEDRATSMMKDVVSRKEKVVTEKSVSKSRKVAAASMTINSKPNQQVQSVPSKPMFVKMHEFEEPVPSNPILKVGTRIAVFWPKDSCFYSAVTEDVKSDIPSAPLVEAFTLHKIKYDLDKKSEWIDLSKHKWKCLRHKSDMPDGMLIVVADGKTSSSSKPSKVAKKETSKKEVSAKKRTAETDLQAKVKKQSSDAAKEGGSKRVMIMKSGTTKQTKARRSIFGASNLVF